MNSFPLSTLADKAFKSDQLLLMSVDELNVKASLIQSHINLNQPAGKPMGPVRFSDLWP
jgi:hypothetical protein